MYQNSIRDPGTEDTAVLAAGVGALPPPPWGEERHGLNSVPVEVVAVLEISISPSTMVGLRKDGSEGSSL